MTIKTTWKIWYKCFVLTTFQINIDKSCLMTQKLMFCALFSRAFNENSMFMKTIKRSHIWLTSSRSRVKFELSSFEMMRRDILRIYTTRRNYIWILWNKCCRKVLWNVVTMLIWSFKEKSKIAMNLTNARRSTQRWNIQFIRVIIEVDF